jgi:hypothetical protein
MKGWLAFVFICLVAPQAPAAAESKPDPVLLWQYRAKDDRIVDILPLNNGAACLLFEKEGPKIRRPGKAELETLNFPSSSDSFEFLRLFPDRKKEGWFWLVGKNEKCPGVWAYQDGKWTHTVRITDEIERPICHQSGDGTIWIYSDNSGIYRADGTNAAYHDCAVWIIRQGYADICYVALNLAEAADGTLCFHSQFENLKDGDAPDHLLLFKNGKWEKPPCPQLQPGLVCFGSNDRLWLAAKNGLTEFSLGKELSRGRLLPLPAALAQELDSPCFLTRLPDGTLLFLWDKPSISSLIKSLLASNHPRSPLPRQSAFEDISFHRILEFNGTQWKAIPIGAGQTEYDYSELTRTFLVDNAGGCWIGAADGMLYRSPKDGQWQKLDWRRGIPCHRPLQMRMGPQGTLWVVDQEGSCLAIAAQKAVASSPLKTAWQQELLCSLLYRREDGLFCAITEEKGGSLVTFGANGKEFNPIPPESLFFPVRVKHLTSDSEGGIWVFADWPPNDIGHFNGKTWTFYKSDWKKGLPFREKEIAFQSLLPKEENFHLGTPADPFYPVFSKDGRIVFQNEYGRVSYFDGKQWHAPHGGVEIGEDTIRSHPFFHKGKVTIVHKGKTYQMDADQWTTEIDDRSRRPWREIHPLPDPFPQKEPKPAAAPGVKSCPIPEDQQQWTLEDGGWRWVGGADRLVCTAGGTNWITIPTTISPLAARPQAQIAAIFSDSFGRWYFKFGDTDKEEYAVYQTQLLPAESGPKDLGQINKPFVPLKLPWRCAQPDKELLFRYRIDAGDWSECQAGREMSPSPELAKGKHCLEVELFGSRELSRSPTLRYSFEITYDIQTLVAECLRKLGARSFIEREQASADLLKYGQAAVPALQAALAGEDPEIVERARELLKILAPPKTEIPRGPASQDSDSNL